MTVSGVLERLPHTGPMLFLDEVLSASDQRIETRVVLRPDFLMLDERGEASPLVCLELFAQSAAALMAHRTADAAAPKVSGALLGTRSITSSVPCLRVGDDLRIVAEEVWGAGALAQFSCELFRGGAVIASGTINVVAGPLPT